VDDLAEIRALQAELEGKDPRLAHLEAIAAELHAEGVDFAVQHGRLYVGPPERDIERSVTLGTKGRLRLAVIADTHFGSIYEQTTALTAFYAEADRRRVDAFIHGGDLTQGTPKMHRGMEHEVHLHSADGQVASTAEKLPKSRRGKKIYILTGNHDDSWINESGTNVVRQVAALRPDVEYIGRDSCYLTLDGLRIYVVHPDGGQSYAKSYRPQKITEAIPIRERTQLVIIAHFHTYGVFKVQESQVVMQPCFQGQYPWLMRKGLYPAIGGVILDIIYDDDGITEFTHTFIEYRERKDDWDREASLRASRVGR